MRVSLVLTGVRCLNIKYKELNDISRSLDIAYIECKVPMHYSAGLGWMTYNLALSASSFHRIFRHGFGSEGKKPESRLRCSPQSENHVRPTLLFSSECIGSRKSTWARDEGTILGGTASILSIAFDCEAPLLTSELPMSWMCPESGVVCGTFSAVCMALNYIIML